MTDLWERSATILVQLLKFGDATKTEAKSRQAVLYSFAAERQDGNPG